jgi:hypothetical protein
MTSSDLQFTTRAFWRSHSREPRGSGLWLFQAATADTAFDHQRHGDLFEFNGTLTEARQALRRSGASGLWAVLP